MGVSNLFTASSKAIALMKPKYSILLFIVLMLRTNIVLAESRFIDYWQVVPSNSACAAFYLPDFEFSEIPIAVDSQITSKNFAVGMLCSQQKGLLG